MNIKKIISFIFFLSVASIARAITPTIDTGTLGSSLSATFSPDGDGTSDEVFINFNAGVGNSWEVQIERLSMPVDFFAGTNSSVRIPWNGRVNIPGQGYSYGDPGTYNINIIIRNSLGSVIDSNSQLTAVSVTNGVQIRAVDQNNLATFLEGARLEVFGANFYDSKFTNPSGYATIYGLKQGQSYSFKLSRNGYLEKNLQFTSNVALNDLGDVTLEPGIRYRLTVLRPSAGSLPERFGHIDAYTNTYSYQTSSPFRFASSSITADLGDTWNVTPTPHIDLFLRASTLYNIRVSIPGYGIAPYTVNLTTNTDQTITLAKFPEISGILNVASLDNPSGMHAWLHACVDQNEDSKCDTSDPNKNFYGGTSFSPAATSAPYSISVPASATVVKYFIRAYSQGFISSNIRANVSNVDVGGINFPIFDKGGILSGSITVNGDTSTNPNPFQVPVSVFLQATQSGGYIEANLTPHPTSTTSSYQISGLADGTYNLWTYLPGFQVNPPGPMNVTISGGIGTKNIVLNENTGDICGTVVPPAGSPGFTMSNVRMELMSFGPDGQGVRSKIPDGSGAFCFNKLNTSFVTIRGLENTTLDFYEGNFQAQNGVEKDITTQFKKSRLVSGTVTSTVGGLYTISNITSSTFTFTYYNFDSSSRTYPVGHIVLKKAFNRNFANNMSGPNNFNDFNNFFVMPFNASGQFSGTIPQGVYELSANVELNGNSSDGPEAANAKQFIEVFDNAVTGLTVQLESGYSISGTVDLEDPSDPETNTRNITISLEQNKRTLNQTEISFSGTSQPFTMPRVAPGLYTLRAVEQEAPPSIQAKYTSIGIPVQVAATNVSGKSIPLQKIAKLLLQLRDSKSGTIVTSSNAGDVLSNSFFIEARCENNTFARAKAINSDGYYSLSLSPNVPCALALGQHGSPSQSDVASGKQVYVNKTINGFKLEAGQTKIFPVDLEPGVTITGEITDSSNLPLPNIIVTAQDDRNEVFISAISDELGKYTLNGLKNNSYYDITVAPSRRPDDFDGTDGSDGLLYVQQKRIHVKAPNVSPGVNFKLQVADAYITGTVVKPDPAGPDPIVPFGDTKVDRKGSSVVARVANEALTDNPLGNHETETDASGNFVLTGLKSGTNIEKLFAIAKGYGTKVLGNIVLTQGENNLGTITLNTGYTASGSIVGEDGSPINQNDVGQLIAFGNDFVDSLAIGNLTTDDDGTVLSWEITGVQEGATKVISVGENDSDVTTIDSLTMPANNVSGIQLTFKKSTPEFFHTFSKNGSDISLQFFFSTPLRNSDVIDNDSDGILDDTAEEILSLSQGNGTLSIDSIEALGSDRQSLTATYTPAANDSKVIFHVNATYEKENPLTQTNYTVDEDVEFFNGLKGLKEGSFKNSYQSSIQIDQTEFNTVTGTFGNNTNLSFDISMALAGTLDELNSASGQGVLGLTKKVGLKAYPGEMASALSRLGTLAADPLGDFLQITLPAGVNHFFPKGKEATLCLSYDSTISDSDAGKLNVYYYNPETNEYVIESQNKVVDTENQRICVDIGHASVFTVFSSSSSVLTGSGGYTGELAVLNFPNPFNLKQKTVTLQNPGSNSSTQNIEGTLIKLSIPPDLTGDAEVEIFNVLGEKIKTLKINIPTAGTHYYLEWNGKNEKGEKVASGTYIARLEIGNKEKFFKMAVLK
ncbi:MAG: hypothetical protein ACKVQC_08240 [Elusimicrobiota bacterium]